MTLVDTGEETQTGGRHQARVPYVERRRRLLPHLRRRRWPTSTSRKLARVSPREQRLATVTGVAAARPLRRARDRTARVVTAFQEKPLGEGGWINGGFFVLSPKVVDYIDGDRDRLGARAAGAARARRPARRLFARGFWQPMDTLRDKHSPRSDCGRPASAVEDLVKPDGASQSRRILPICGAPLARPSSTSACRRSRTPTSSRSDLAPRASAFYPLHAYVCDECLLVQLPEFETPERDLRRLRLLLVVLGQLAARTRARYAEQMIARFGLDASSQVVEIASNDGYLLQYFRERGIPVLGIEPAANVAAGRAEARASRPLVEFFGARPRAKLAARAAAGRSARRQQRARARAGPQRLRRGHARSLLAPDGVDHDGVPAPAAADRARTSSTRSTTSTSPTSRSLTVERVFAAHGLTLFDVEELPTHGGSLRIYARHAEDAREAETDARRGAARARARGRARPARDLPRASPSRSSATKRALLELPDRRASERARRVVGYGAPAKGNTLLNYCGVRTDFLDYTVDRSPHKQGRFLPGTRIPIHAPERIARDAARLRADPAVEPARRDRRADGAHPRVGRPFVVPIPTLEVV